MFLSSIAINIGNLEDALRLAHGGLDVEGLDVLPVLLEEGDEEVDGNLDVSVNLVLGHLNVGHSDTEGKDLLELELDGTTDGVDLLVGVLGVLEEGWELTELVHGRSEETRNLLHDGGRGKEEVVAVGELLDLVERLETLDIHARDAGGLGLLAVLGITKDATGYAWARNVRELDGTGETLILLRIVVLEDHLELDGFTELALLVLGTLED